MALNVAREALEAKRWEYPIAWKKKTLKIKITVVWKENKTRRKKEKLTGALRRKGDQRLGVEHL